MDQPGDFLSHILFVNSRFDLFNPIPFILVVTIDNNVGHISADSLQDLVLVVVADARYFNYRVMTVGRYRAIRKAQRRRPQALSCFHTLYAFTQVSA